ncbi:MAG: family 16 glycoside hydrolase, partial [Verrucomicrobiales bacterium]
DAIFPTFPLSDGTTPLLFGKVGDAPAEPLAWTMGAGKFYTSLGTESDFANAAFNKMLLNACHWCVEKTPIPAVQPNSTPAPPHRILALDETVIEPEDWRHWDPSMRPAVLERDPVADTTSGGPTYKDARWIENGRTLLAQPGHGDILTKRSFGDAVYHANFLLPDEPGANSGVFIDGKWEIQLVNSYGSDQLDDKTTCGAIFGVAAPMTNACGKPGTWQSLRVAVQHVHESAADVSVWLNDIQIHKRVRLEEPTLHGFPQESEETGREAWFVSNDAQGRSCDMGKDFTAVMRFRTEDQGPLFSKLSPDGKHRENDKVLFIAGGRLHYDIGWVGAISSDKDVNDSKWHTVALRSKEGLAAIYLDGEKLVEKKNFSAPDNEGSVIRLGAGANDFPDGDARHWEGEFDHFQFFAEALSDQDLELTGGSEPIERVKAVLDWKGLAKPEGIEEEEDENGVGQ